MVLLRKHKGIITHIISRAEPLRGFTGIMAVREGAGTVRKWEGGGGRGPERQAAERLHGDRGRLQQMEKTDSKDKRLTKTDKPSDSLAGGR